MNKNCQTYSVSLKTLGLDNRTDDGASRAGRALAEACDVAASSGIWPELLWQWPWSSEIVGHVPFVEVAGCASLAWTMEFFGAARA